MLEIIKQEKSMLKAMAKYNRYQTSGPWPKAPERARASLAIRRD